MSRRSAALTVSLLLSSALWLACAGKPAPRPNVVLIVADTLRADRLGAYGHTGALSPTIDAIAAEGVVVERAIAHAPWTQPSVASLLTGLYPTVHGVIDWKTAARGLSGRSVQVPVLDESLDTLPELMRRAGYQTAAFVANPLLTEEFGFSQGFDAFDSSFARNRTPGSTVNATALEWLDRRDPERPFFLLLVYMDVHGPYDARPEFLDPLLDAVDADAEKRPMPKQARRRLAYLNKPASAPNDLRRHERLADYREYWAARYDAGVRELDESLRALRDALAERDLWSDSYLVFTSDHGEALREHGHWNHGMSLHGPEIDVPLIFRWSGVLPADRRLGGIAQQTDIVPTLAEQLRLEVPDGLQGESLAEALREGTGSTGSVAFSEGVKGRPGRKAIYSGHWKLLRNPGNRQLSLYDLRTDPLEQTDLAETFRDEALRLNALLEEQVALNKALRGAHDPEEVPLTEDQIDRLRALGYIE